MQDHPLITNLERLFRYSGMIDQLRDTSRILLDSKDIAPRTISDMGRQYDDLRNALRSTLVEDARCELDTWTPVVDPSETTVDNVFFASAALARFIDLVHQTPKFLVAEEIAGVAAIEMTAKAKASMESIEHRASTPTAATGTYL